MGNVRHINKSDLIEKIQLLIDNPGTDGEKRAAESVLHKIKEKYKTTDVIRLATMRDCRQLRCDRCVSACISGSQSSFRAVCGYAPKGFAITGNYLDGKSPDRCPHKIKAYLECGELAKVTPAPATEGGEDG